MVDAKREQSYRAAARMTRERMTREAPAQAEDVQSARSSDVVRMVHGTSPLPNPPWCGTTSASTWRCTWRRDGPEPQTRPTGTPAVSAGPERLVTLSERLSIKCNGKYQRRRVRSGDEGQCAE